MEISSPSSGSTIRARGHGGTPQVKALGGSPQLARSASNDGRRRSYSWEVVSDDEAPTPDLPEPWQQELLAMLGMVAPSAQQHKLR